MQAPSCNGECRDGSLHFLSALDSGSDTLSAHLVFLVVLDDYLEFFFVKNQVFVDVTRGEHQRIGGAETESSGAGRPWQLFTLICVGKVFFYDFEYVFCTFELGFFTFFYTYYP
ncbi:hypothetical protein H671_2g5182 [Cricetulus griseus]|nr:hypothetical protein H671_2g5182 [Cricetulus griseus]